MEQKPHIAIVTTPGMGLFIPMVEFGKQLVHFHGFHVTCIIPNIPGPLTDTMKSALPSSVDQVFLPPVSLPQGTGADVGSLIWLSITLSLPLIRKVLKTLAESSRLVGLLGDVFSIVAFDVAKELNIIPYVFFSSTMELSLYLHQPELDEMFPSPEVIQLPGCVPIPERDLIITDRSSQLYKWLLENSKRVRLVKGIVVNAFLDLHPAAILALQQEGSRNPPIYPIGPLVQDSSPLPPVPGNEEQQDCLRWLDDQPRGSVLFVSFGSGGTLSEVQTNELALGLEMSGHKFLWAVRSPNDESASAAYLGGGQGPPKHPSHFLPQGFVERTKGRGVLVPFWAPQPQILKHGSTGGFLTHCGWNSILESIVNGVPLIAWPLFAEQNMNALMLTVDVKIAVRPRANEDGLVGREEVAKIVKALMEGDEGKRTRERIKELEEAAAKAVGEGGSSRKAFSQLALDMIHQSK
ncbi:hypothetical protein SLA2020_126990 [Shorea laevis]